MSRHLSGQIFRRIGWIAAAMALAVSGGPLAAQSMRTIDPDLVIDGDLAGESTTVAPDWQGDVSPGSVEPADNRPILDLPPAEPVDVAPEAPQADAATYGQDDLIGAAEGLFGRGAEGLARLIQDVLEDQGEPIGYIVGREAGGAFVLGARYGSGTLHHKIEGNRQVYWTGPSIGFDVGANASNTFVLVYNLYDTQELFERFPSGEGQAYFVGGFTASYMRRGDIVLIPIRVGAGLRLGINAGYMRFSQEQRWSPF